MQPAAPGANAQVHHGFQPKHRQEPHLSLLMVPHRVKQVVHDCHEQRLNTEDQRQVHAKTELAKNGRPWNEVLDLRASCAREPQVVQQDVMAWNELVPRVHPHGAGNEAVHDGMANKPLGLGCCCKHHATRHHQDGAHQRLATHVPGKAVVTMHVMGAWEATCIASWHTRTTRLSIEWRCRTPELPRRCRSHHLCRHRCHPTPIPLRCSMPPVMRRTHVNR